MILERTQSGITTKFLVRGNNSLAAEVVLVERPEKNIICFSTQYGCLVGCQFCVSGKENKPVRSLSYGEMLELIEVAYNHAAKKDKPWVLSAMGEGDPSLNIDSVLDVLANTQLRISTWQETSVKTAISTVAPTTKKFAELLYKSGTARVPPKIQFSLHSAHPHTRSQLIRGSKIDMFAAGALIRGFNYLKYDINMVLIKGVNDSRDELSALAAWMIATELAGQKNVVVKFSTYNPIDGSDFVATSDEIVQGWCDFLEELKIKTERYSTDGSNINAACGQLRKRHIPNGFSH